MITIETKALRDALGGIGDVIVGGAETVPILSNVLLEATGNTLALTATDLDLQLRRTVPLATSDLVAEPLRVTTNAKVLSSVVRKLPLGGQATLKIERGQLALICGRSRFMLATLPIEDFPAIPHVAADLSFSIEAKALLDLINRTRFAVSTEETRYYLNGIYFHAVNSEAGEPMLTAAATDGSRLARVVMPAPEGAEELAGIIVPRKAYGVLRTLLDGLDDDVRIEVATGRICIHIGDDTLTTKLIDGTFPDYVRVIPRDNSRVLKVDPKALGQAIDRVTTIASEKVRAVKLDIGGDKIALSVRSPEHGSADEELSADYAAEAIEIGFNAKFLTEVLRHVSGDMIEICMGDAAGPCLLRENEDADAVYVLMPFRI